MSRSDDDHFDIDLTESGEGCRLIGYQHSRGSSFRALCRCGWGSPPSSSAGMAGSAFDAHVEERARDREASS